MPNEGGVWRDGLGVKNTSCSCKEPVFSSQHPHGSPKLSVAPILGDLTHSSHLCGHQAHLGCTCVHGGKALKHIEKKRERKVGHPGALMGTAGCL